MRDTLLHYAIEGDAAALLRYEAAVMNNEFEPFTCHEIIAELLCHTKPEYAFGKCASALWLHLGIFWRHSAHWYSHAFSQQYQTLIKHAKENMGTNAGIITFLLMVDTELPDDAKLLKLADYKKMVALSRPHAGSSTNSLAQFNLAYMYLNGINFDKEQKSNLSFKRLARCGIDKDARMGYKFCKKAAEQRLSIALHILGTLQLKGIGTYVDYYGAMDTYKKAAQLSCVLTQALFGDVSDPDGLLHSVYYGEMPTSESVKWCHKAAERGYAPAQFKLANMYFDGHVVEKNIQEAYKWFLRAAEHGYAPAQLTLAESIELDKFKSIDTNHSSLYWKEQLALQGSAKALYQLGETYLFKTKLNEAYFNRGIKYLIKASQAGEERAQNVLNTSIKNLLCSGKREWFWSAVDIIVRAKENGVNIDQYGLYTINRVMSYLAEKDQLELVKRFLNVTESYHKNFIRKDPIEQILGVRIHITLFDLFAKYPTTLNAYFIISSAVENLLAYGIIDDSNLVFPNLSNDNYEILMQFWRWMVQYIEMRPVTPRINQLVSLGSLKYLFAHNHNASSYLGILPVELLGRIACFTNSRETKPASPEDMASEIFTSEHFAIAKLQLNIVTTIKNIAEHINTMSIKSKASKAKIEAQMNVVLKYCQNIMNTTNNLNKIIAQFKAPDKTGSRFTIFARDNWYGYPNYMKQFAEILQPLAGKLDDKAVLEDALEQLDTLASQLKLMYQPASMPIKMARSIS